MASLLTTATFAVVVTAFLIATATLSSPGPPGGEPAGSGAGTVRAGAKVVDDPDPDLEIPTVEVQARGEGVVYRLGSREAGSAAELQALLEPLARMGGAISVRISHDRPFARSAEAIAACQAAGFATILLVPVQPGH
jgi:hypothetical protein